MEDMTAYYQPPPPGLHSCYPPHTAGAAALAPVAPVPAALVIAPHDPYYPSRYQHSALASYSQLISPSSFSQDGVRTLFVAGLPEDVKPREIYNLFREFPGFESSNLRVGEKRFAFAEFRDQQSALVAMHAISGMEFDLEKGSTLHIELAKSNSRTKRLRTEDVDKPGSDKKFKGSPLSLTSFDTGLGSFHISGMGNSAHNIIGYPSTQSSRGSSPNAGRLHNPPCPTLFVANLGPSCNELELNQIFSRCRGFIKLKMQSPYGRPVAFVDFEDTASSSEALSQLQGAILYSSTDGEGMRLEFAKSRMGMRKKPK